jgi:hypothetical protein
MDRYWYHVLLRGAVKHGEKLEKNLKSKVPDIGLGTTISEESRTVKILGVTMNSSARLTIFYVLGFIMLAVIFVTFVFALPNRAPPTAVSAPSNAQAVPPTQPENPQHVSRTGEK